jgi:uncharacterized protein YuzE
VRRDRAHLRQRSVALGLVAPEQRRNHVDLAKYGIGEREVEAAIRSFDVRVPAKRGCVNCFKAVGPKRRIRVTLDPQTHTVVTVYLYREEGQVVVTMTIDSEAGALYLQFSTAPVASQDSLDEHHMLNVDRDADRHVVGIEMIRPDPADWVLVGEFVRHEGLPLDMGLLPPISQIGPTTTARPA